MEIGSFKCGGIYIGVNRQGRKPPQNLPHFGSNEYTRFIRTNDQLRIYSSKDALCGGFSRRVCTSFLK